MFLYGKNKTDLSKVNQILLLEIENFCKVIFKFFYDKSK